MHKNSCIYCNKLTATTVERTSIRLTHKCTKVFNCNHPKYNPNSKISLITLFTTCPGFQPIQE